MGQSAMSGSCIASNEAKVDAGEALSLAAHKIKRFREENRLSAAQLADELGVSQPAVFYWETGQKKPRMAMQAALHRRGICEPNDWHQPAPAANDDGSESAA